MHKFSYLRTVSAVLLTTLLAKAGFAQEPKEPPQDPAPATKKLAEWPSLKKAESDRARSLVSQYRKPKEELYPEASRKLIELGAGVAPIMIPLVNDRSHSINEHLFGVLDAVLDKTHAALLARESKRPSVAWRRFLMHKLASFHDAEMAPVFKSALKDKDPDIAFHSALGLLSLGNQDGLDIVILAAKQRWTELDTVIAEILPAGRSEQSAMPIFEKIAAARPTDQMAGLRLLRYLMTKQQSMLLRSYLESADFQVKKEAINTARVLHGEKPMDKLSSFQAINEAKKWLGKL